jgi:hypothetical protein
MKAVEPDEGRLIERVARALRESPFRISRVSAATAVPISTLTRWRRQRVMSTRFTDIETKMGKRY